MPSMLVTFGIFPFHSERSSSKSAPPNMYAMLVALGIFHLDRPRTLVLINVDSMLVMLDTSQVGRFSLKLLAPLNMPLKLVTLGSFHLDNPSPLND